MIGCYFASCNSSRALVRVRVRFRVWVRVRIRFRVRVGFNLKAGVNKYGFGLVFKCRFTLSSRVANSCTSEFLLKIEVRIREDKCNVESTETGNRKDKRNKNW